MLKLRQIITCAKWVDGSGYSYTEILSDDIVDMAGETVEDVIDDFDWSWWDLVETIKELKRTAKNLI